MRWGEVIALRPRHIDFLRCMVSVEDTIVETSKKNSPSGERFLVKRYPKNNEPRTFGVRQAWLDEVAAHIRTKSIARNDLLFYHEGRHPDLSQHLPHPGLTPHGEGKRSRRQRPDPRRLPCTCLLAAGRWIGPQVSNGPDGSPPNPDDPEVPSRVARRRPKEPGRPRPNRARKGHLTTVRRWPTSVRSIALRQPSGRGEHRALEARPLRLE